MRIFITSDTHFNHSNVIPYCNRPFKDVEEMNNILIKNWNNVVSKKDVVYHLGDFAFAGKQIIVDIVSKLNGRIKLIRGNHDTKSNQYYRDAGFDECYDKPIILNDFIVLSHEPLPFVPSPTMVNIFGHVHDSPMFETYGPQHVCVCVERHDYKPVDFEEIKKHFENK